MIFNIPMNGIARIIPENPHTAAPSNIAMTEISALILTLEPTIYGMRK